MSERLNHRPQPRLPIHPRRKVPADLRKRVVKACNECNVRKVKCSGGWPCVLCASNSRTCAYPAIVEKVTVPRAELEELRSKVAMYEKLLPNGLRDVERLQSLLQSAARSEVSPPLSDRAAQLSLGAGEVSPDAIVAKIEPSDNNIIVAPARLFEDSDGIGRYFGETSGTVFLTHLRDRIGAAILAAEQDSPDLPSENSRPNLGSDSVYDTLQPHELAVNPFWLPPDDTITADMAELRYLIQDGLGYWPSGGVFWWGDLETLPTRPPLSMMPTGDAIEYRYLAFYNAVMALVSETTAFWRPQQSPKNSELTAAEQYYARAAILMGNPLNVKGRTMADVAALGVMSLYLIEVCAQDAAYMCITAAIHLSIALGAHRLWTDEKNTRIFWSVYALDRWLSCLMGRPQTISDDDIQLPLPADAPSMPPAAGLRANVQLSRISGHVVKSFHNVTETTSDIREPDNTIHKLETWRAALPPVMQLSVDGLSNDPACCLLHMRCNQLFIVAIRPYFYSAMEANQAGPRAQTSPIGSSSQLEQLKHCVAAGRRNIRLGNHVMALVDRRMLIHPISHFIFNAGISIALGNLVLSHEISPEELEAGNRDVDFAIDRLTESYMPECEDPGSLAAILRELKALIEKLTTARLLSDSAVEPSQHAILQSRQPEMLQSVEQFPMQVGENLMLYDELMGWMGDNWPMYDAAYMGE